MIDWHLGDGGAVMDEVIELATYQDGYIIHIWRSYIDLKRGSVTEH